MQTISRIRTLGKGHNCKANGSWHWDIAPALLHYQKMSSRSLVSTNDCFSLKSTSSYITFKANKRHHGSSGTWRLGRHHQRYHRSTKSTKAPTSLRPWHWELLFHENAVAFKRTASILPAKLLDHIDYIICERKEFLFQLAELLKQLFIDQLT